MKDRKEIEVGRNLPGILELPSRRGFPRAFLGLLLVMAAAFGAKAQTNSAPVRLAVIVSDPSAAAAADLLTVELTKAAWLQLLERAEIDRIRREQGLSAANQDNLKLGQILGADGLLLLEPGQGSHEPVPDGALGGGETGRGHWELPFPVAGGGPGAMGQVDSRPFWTAFPKLGVLVKDAVPISVVNLRSAVRSAEAQEAERQIDRARHRAPDARNASCSCSNGGAWTC